MKSAPLGTARDADWITSIRDSADTPFTKTALDVVALALHDLDEYERRLRSFKRLAAIGNDPLDANDDCRLPQRVLTGSGISPVIVARAAKPEGGKSVRSVTFERDLRDLAYAVLRQIEPTAKPPAPQPAPA